MKISIESIKKDAYQKAESRFKTYQKINLANFILNIVFLFLTFFYLENLFYYRILNIYVAIILLLYVFMFIWDNKYTKYREIAEELRIIQFNKANLHIDITPEKKSYLLPSILPRKTPFDNAEIDYNANYFENQNLKFSLLQNIFYTQKTFKYHSSFYQKILWLLFIFTLLIFILLTFLSKCLFTDINENQPLIFQAILCFFNLITTTRYYLIYQSFKNKSETLKDLDAELVNTNSSNENKAISLLIEYNTLLVDSYQTFSFIYNEHHEVLKIAWNERITSYNKEKLLVDFKENIEKDLKLLLSSLKELTYKENQIIGSYLDNSFVNGKSDLDILLVFENNDEISPEEFYCKIFNVLKIKFGNNLKQSLPSFIVQNFSNITIEFTPCLYIEDDRYKIVISNYEFDEISPNKYSEYFKLCNKISDGKFNIIIKDVMKWKYRENYSISSIYLKIYLSNFIQSQDNEKNLHEFLKELVKTKLQNINNPIERNKILAPCNEIDKQKLIYKIQSFLNT